MADLLSAVRRFLADLEAAQTGLRGLLAEKRRALAAADTAGLERLAGVEAERVRTLQALLARRRGLLEQAAERGMAAESITALVETLAGDDRAALKEQVERVRAAADEIRRETWVHWIVTRSIAGHYAELLELIATCGQESPTYSERPPTHAPAGGAILDASV